MLKPLVDLTGQRFGHLLVTSYISRGQWSCKCDCGKETKAYSHNMARGKTKSCGCLYKKSRSKCNLRHGATRNGRWTTEYNIWTRMIQRCRDSNDRGWRHYGGRGISVCARWMKFENFLEDMGKRPPHKSIDRIDNDGNYEPSNCRWATTREQRANRSDSVRA